VKNKKKTFFLNFGQNKNQRGTRAEYLWSSNDEPL